MKTNIKILFLAALIFTACNEKDDVIPVVPEEALTAGTANFSKYVAVGNSLSAGYSDGTLFKEGQLNSWTNILSQEFAKVGGGAFKIPLMPDDNIGGFLKSDGTQDRNYPPRLFFRYVTPSTDPCIPTSGPTAIPQMSTAANSTVLTGGFNNMGVPGAKVWHLPFAGYGFANPFFKRFASSPGASILGDAVAQAPTFFSLWIGNNDVLSYASSGGIGVNQLGNLNPGLYGVNDITDPQVFAGSYQAILSDQTGLRKNGAKGVIANVPYVTSVPFFTTVPTNPVPLPEANFTALNELFGPLNAYFTSLGETNPRFATLGAKDNPLLIIDETLVSREAEITGALTPKLGPFAASVGKILAKARHARKTGNRDYILLTTRGVIGVPINSSNPCTLQYNDNTTVIDLPAAQIADKFSTLGVSYPLQDRHVLTADETMQVKIATDAYNTTIKGFATLYGLAFIDTNALLNKVATVGIPSNGFTITSAYATGGAFSLDGVHPSPRGYALIANEFMKVINLTYGSNLKPVDISKYRVQFPKAF